jgi:hypothetical protein
VSEVSQTRSSSFGAMVRLRQAAASSPWRHSKENHQHHSTAEANLPPVSHDGHKPPMASRSSCSSKTSPKRRTLTLPSLSLAGNNSDSNNNSNIMMALSCKNRCFLLCLVLAVFKIIDFQGSVGRSNGNPSSRNTSSALILTDGTIVSTMGGAFVVNSLRRSIQRPRAILLTETQRASVVVPMRMPTKRLRITTNILEHNPDLGGLKIEMMTLDNAMREIPDITAREKRHSDTKHGPGHGDEDDGSEDDDEISKYMLPYADDSLARQALLKDTNQTCTRRPWHRTIYPTCNSFHETDLHLLLTEGDPYYIGGGSYRTVYLATRGTDSSLAREDVVWKTSGLKHGIYADTVGSFLMDGVLGAALTPNPRLVSMWGFCAVSMFSEVVRYVTTSIHTVATVFVCRA